MRGACQHRAALYAWHQEAGRAGLFPCCDDGRRTRRQPIHRYLLRGCRQGTDWCSRSIGVPQRRPRRCPMGRTGRSATGFQPRAYARPESAANSVTIPLGDGYDSVRQCVMFVAGWSLPPYRCGRGAYSCAPHARRPASAGIGDRSAALASPQREAAGRVPSSSRHADGAHAD
jgi:hypothetical protein